MVKVIFPSYMIGKNDNVDLIEYTDALMFCDSKKSILQILSEASKRAPDAFAKIINDFEINKGVIIVYNNTILRYENFEKIIPNDNDTIEILVQFAGG